VLIATTGQFSAKLFKELSHEHEIESLADIQNSSKAADVRVLIARGNLRVTEAVLLGLPGLELVLKAGSGLNTIDQVACRARGVKVIATGGSERSVAELAVGLVFACLRRLSHLDLCVRNGNFAAKHETTGGLVAGRSVGILGFGATGRHTATILSAIGAEVHVYDRSISRPDKQALLSEIQASAASSIEDLLSCSDILLIHLPLNDATRNLLGADRLTLLPAGAIVVNTSRAGIVAPHALLRALEDNRIGAAGLDVHYEEEGVSMDRIRTHPNVTSTPHIGAQTVEAKDEIANRLVRQVRLFADAKAGHVEANVC